MKECDILKGRRVKTYSDITETRFMLLELKVYRRFSVTDGVRLDFYRTTQCVGAVLAVSPCPSICLSVRPSVT